jgi:hypothetical protein
MQTTRKMAPRDGYLPVHEPDEAAHGERREVGLAHEQALEDHGVEVALGPPHQEAVELRTKGDLSG